MSRFEVSSTPLDGLKVVRRQRIGDSRGFLARLFCSDELSSAGWHGPVAQINHTFTEYRGTVRGMHFQRGPHAEVKLVNCLKGEVWDVAVDLRQGSLTFMKWHAVLLSAENGDAMLIPRGFAHGFQSLTDDVEMLYCHSHRYEPQSEDGLNPLDDRIDISWPLAIAEISARDIGHEPIATDFKGLAA